MITMWILLVFTGVTATALSYIVYDQAVQNSSLRDQIEWERDQRQQAVRAWDMDTRIIEDKERVISALGQENKDLYRRLDRTILERDVRPPADPIVAWLARHGPAHIAQLIEHFGRRVSIDLARLAEHNLVETDDQHLHWNVITPAEARGRVTRTVPAMTGATRNESQVSHDVLATQHMPEALRGAHIGAGGDISDRLLNLLKTQVST